MSKETRFRANEYNDEALFRDTIVGTIGAQIREFHGEDISTFIAEKNDYAYLYHLSDLRANVIRHLPFTGQEKVLEIGGDCGSITSYLAEETSRVTVLEDHALMRVVDSLRNEKFDNITYRDETIQAYLDRTKGKGEADRYDLITCIASFDYVPAFYHTELLPEASCLQFLKQVKKHLKDKGTLVIASPNRLGLKYFAGCKEEHSARYFHGIEGFEPEERIRTYTRNEWQQMLTEAGYTEVTFAYPYPDHLFTMQLFTDQRLPELEDADNDYKNFAQMRMATFDEAKVMRTLTENGLFPQFSNSFLITAR